MPRHALSRDEQIRGTEKALANPKTPKQLRPSLQKRLDELRAQTPRGSR
jgi:hypothetical protein